MSVVQSTFDWASRLSDWGNPILIKETRQALKSRQFVATFMLVLGASWIISVFGMLWAGDAIHYGATGREFFFLYDAVLTVAVLLIVPFGASRALLAERDMNTYELLSITTLSPRQIVWGKLLSAIVQILIYYSALAPFIAFTSLLEGFDLAQVILLLVGLFIAAVMATMLSLMFTAIARHRAWQTVISVGVLGALGGLVLISLNLSGAIMDDVLPLEDPDFWWLIGLMLTAVASYFVLFLQITTSQLTFESDNRSSAVRVTCIVQVLLWMAGWWAYSQWGPSGMTFDFAALSAFSLFPAAQWTVVGVMMATESDELSRRILRNLWRHPLVRLFVAPLLPGGARGLLYLLLQLLLLWGVLVGLALYVVSTSRNQERSLLLATALVCYIWCYIGLGAALGRWAGRLTSEIRPAHVRVLILLLAAAGLIGPYLPELAGFGPQGGQYSLLYVTNLFVTIDEFVDRRLSDSESVIAFVLLVSGAFVVLLMNVPAMWRGVQDVIRADVKPAAPPVPAAGPATPELSPSP